MSCQVSCLSEGLLTYGTLVRLLPVVRAQMRLQRGLPRVGLSTYVAGVGSRERVPGWRSYDGAAGNVDRRWRRGVVEGTVRLGVRGRVAEGAWYPVHWCVGVGRIHRRVVGVAIIIFLRTQGYSGSGGTVASIAGSARARLGAFQRGTCRRSVPAVFRLDRRHAAADAVGRGRTGAVNDGLLQANQRLGCHVPGWIQRWVHGRLCWEYARPVMTKKDAYNTRCSNFQ